MDNQLTQKTDFGVTMFSGKAVVSSRQVAEIFEKRHDHVLRDIQNIIDVLPNLGEPVWKNNFIKSTYKDRGKDYPEYLLTRDGFTLLTMGFTGAKAMKFKIAFVDRFNEMEQYIATRTAARLESRDLTKAIDKLHIKPAFYHYSNEFGMINRIVLGMPAKEFRLMHGIPKNEPIRDHLSLEQIEAINKLQNFDAHLATMIPDYSQRKKILEEYYCKNTKFANLPLAKV